MPVSDRIRKLISDARKNSPFPNSSTSVLHAMMDPRFQRAMKADKDVVNFVMGRGLEALIRAYLKMVANGDAGEEGMSRIQADFWPETVRQIVIDIGRARVYVPSRMEYVPLMPGTIQRDEIKEAGDYLIGKGEECLRIGNRLIHLHQMWDERPAPPTSTAWAAGQADPPPVGQ